MPFSSSAPEFSLWLPGTHLWAVSASYLCCSWSSLEDTCGLFVGGWQKLTSQRFPANPSPNPGFNYRVPTNKEGHSTIWSVDVKNYTLKCWDLDLDPMKKSTKYPFIMALSGWRGLWLQRPSQIRVCCFQTGGYYSKDHHAGHVVCGRLPLDDCERAESVTGWSTHPHSGPPLIVFWCHPSHHDDGLNCHEGREQGYTSLGK